MYGHSMYDFMKEALTFHLLLVTCWNSLVACYSLKNHSLVVAKFARYSSQKLLVAKNQFLVVCKIRSLLIREVAHCKKALLTGCKICSLLVAKGVFLWIFAKFSDHLYFEDICKRLLVYNIKTSTNFFIVFYLTSINFWLWLNCS